MNTKPGAVVNLATQVMVIPVVWWLDPWLAVTMLVIMAIELVMLVKVWRKL